MSTDSTASSSPPPTRYFDLLPLELIRSIIEQLAPIEYDQNTYEERERTLYSTCLVSRLFRNLAQPLLFEIIEINGKDEMQMLNELLSSDSGRRLLSITRIMVPYDVKDLVGKRHELAWTAAVVRLEYLQVLGGSLSGLNISSKSDFTLSCTEDPLKVETDLNSLHLSHVYVHNGFELELPHLEFLSLACTNVRVRPFTSFHLPVLRHFAFFDRTAHYTDAESASFVSLAPQITSMTFVLNLFKKLPALVLNTSTGSLLFDCHCLGDSEVFKACATQLSFLRIYQCDQFGPYSNYNCAFKEMWESWTALFGSSDFRTSLQVLYLDDPSTFSTGAKLAEINLAREGFVEVCRRRNIEVVYEVQNTSEVESQISTDFVRRSEARRRVIEAGERVGGK